MTCDMNGNLVSQEDISGKVVWHRYNALDISKAVDDNNDNTQEQNCYPDGTIKSLKNGSLYTEYAYDGDKNLTSLKTMLGQEVLVDNHYCYDHNGNRTERQQPGGTTRYTYDSVNQLTQIEYPTYTEQLYYDKAGNRSRRITDGTQEEYRYDPANHLTEYTRGGEAKTFTYDKAGNLTADDRARYTYDLFNRTEKVETFDGHIQINHYDAEGLRSGIEEDGRLVQFIFRSQEVVTQLEEEKGMTRYIRGYDLIASDADCARTYYHYASDELGSITHVVAGEDILNRYEYDAWGNLTLCEETVENRFKFNGQQYDPISQQYYLRARYYNPVIGRFTQEDTYRGDGLNLYAYCRNNPVYYADPSGHYRNCVKDAYDRIRQENPGMSAQDAYNLALRETGKERLNSDQGHQAAPDVPTQGSNNRVAGDTGAEGRGNDTAQNTEQNRPSNPEIDGPDHNNREHNRDRESKDNSSKKGRTLNEWLADYPELLAECKQWFEQKPEWWGIDPNETDVYYRTPDEVKAIRNKPGESGGHHPHGLALGGPTGQTLTPTGETVTIKNPTHSKVTGLQRRVINIIKNKET